MKPYEDEQFNVQPMSKIQRIPLLVDPQTGQVIPEFQKFYDSLVAGILANDPREIYEISDKSLDPFEFIQTYECKIGNELDKIAKNSLYYQIDIQMNMDRFQNKFRTILGSFYLTILQFTRLSSGDIKMNATQLKTGETEIFFRYDNGFKLISKFDPVIFESV